LDKTFLLTFLLSNLYLLMLLVVWGCKQSNSGNKGKLYLLSPVLVHEERVRVPYYDEQSLGTRNGYIESLKIMTEQKCVE